jgi:hypothetical protein
VAFDLQEVQVAQAFAILDQQVEAVVDDQEVDAVEKRIILKPVRLESGFP